MDRDFSTVTAILTGLFLVLLFVVLPVTTIMEKLNG